jgi:hypothetical protein
MQLFDLGVICRIFDMVSGRIIKSMFYSITGTGPAISYLLPQTYEHFATNSKGFYPLQIPQLNDLFIAYLMQAP